jgi:hypothetical protein
MLAPRLFLGSVFMGFYLVSLSYQTGYQNFENCLYLGDSDVIAILVSQD